MHDFFHEYWKYVIGAVLVHLLIAGIVALTALTPHATPPAMLAIEAVVVDRSVLEAPARRERERREAEERRRQAQERQRQEQQQQQEERQKQQAEEQARREADAEAERQEQQRKQAEQAAAERAKAAEAERKQRVEAERQKRDQAERERIADIQRRQREAEERRRAEAEQRAQAMAENDLQRQIAEEEGRNAAANAGLLNQYIALLQQRIVRNWNRPPSARPGIQCKVTVTQAPGGTVLKAEVGECNGDAAVRQSIEAAVLRSSPLPPPPDARLFERTLILWFKPAE